MFYTSFRIKNFKGIKDTEIRLVKEAKMGVFAFVGLNESGKTTILEAIHSFSPDRDTSKLVGGDDTSGVPYEDRVPRHQISNFSGRVSIGATIRFEEGEKEELLNILKSAEGLVIDEERLPNEVTIEREQVFENGDFKVSYFTLRTPIYYKKNRQKKWRKASTKDELTKLRDYIYELTPDIAYFPTFVFDFPKRIFLTEERGDPVSKFYRGVFQDILDFDGQGHTIEESIIRRIRSDDKIVSWLDFLSIWNTSDDRDKIQHVVDRASAVVSEVVFGRWNQIFNEDVKGKEINISFETLEGERKSADGAKYQTNEHDVYIKFQIKDGTRRFNVNDRSLGFRWFFAFMLFTQFRVARENTRPILFLFDEPASNLHAAAQQKLIESFPEIAKGSHSLAYSTHSHYMIEPKWLEQTFIVSNRSDAPIDSVIGALSLSDESLDITATRYRDFVNKYPSQTSYFQPVLDRLEVTPSKFDFREKSVVVEGKSDYYILRYAIKLLEHEGLSLIPGLGAGTFGALVALDIGWGLGMIFLLDGDAAGEAQRTRYVTEYGLSSERAVLLSDISPDIIMIEDLLDDEAKSIVSASLGLKNKPTKNHIRRFFSENLANDNVIPLGEYFDNKAGAVIDRLQEILGCVDNGVT